MSRLVYLFILFSVYINGYAQDEPFFVDGHFNDVTNVAYSPDGEYLVTGCWDGSLYIYINDSVPQYYLSFGDQTSPITSLAFSRDSRKLLSASFDGKIIMYDFPHPDSLYGYISVDTVFEFTNKPINKVYYGPGLRMIFAADEAGKLIAYDLTKKMHRDVKTEGPVKSFAVSIDRMNYFIATANSPTIVQYNIQGKEIRRFEGHTGNVNDLEVTVDRKYLVSASSDKTVKIWNLQTGKLVKSFENHSWDITALALDPYSKYILSCGIDGLVNVYDIASLSLVNSFQNTNGRCMDISLSPDLTKVAVGLQMDNVSENGYGCNVWSTGLKRPTPKTKAVKATSTSTKTTTNTVKKPGTK